MNNQKCVRTSLINLTLVLTVITILNFSESFVLVNGDESLDYRLPENVRPSQYDLTMRMVLDENQDGFQIFTAPGNVTIAFECTKRTDNITLNIQFIEIVENGVQLTESATSSPVPISGHSYQPDLHFYTIQLNKALEIGDKYQLFLPFVSQILTNDTLGLYRGYYNDSLANNVTKNMATTFFEPFGGRRAFPCFDEPDLKAVFNFRIGRLAKYHTLVNMDLNKTVADPNYQGWQWDQFNPSVPMSPYTVCVIVSDFAYEEADPSIFKGKPVKVWGTPAAIQEGGGVFAAEMGAHLLNWYENYTGIPYALPKMDSIAIPQFAAGAMENWGLNTYRDYLLIYKPSDPDSAYIGVAETLSHELSHQWFGNLATCKWWDQMWLNEGLATFFTYKALITILPEFDTEMRYITKHQQNALKFDSNPNKSHPVVIPTDGFNFFDGTSMEKGGALTRMIEYIFSKPVLKIGLRSYLEKNAYRGAVQDSLFEALQDAIEQQGLSNALPARASVKDVMDTWTLQTGYPLLRVRRDTTSLIFTQENIIPSQPSHSWWVPIKVVTEADPSFTSHISDVWIAPTEVSASFPLSGDALKGWIIVNPDSAGFYRVLYEDSLYQLIQDQLNKDPNSFTPITRSQIIDDYTNLGLLGLVPLSEAMKITEYLPNERNVGVLISAVKNIQLLLNKFQINSDPRKEILLGRLEKVLDNFPTETRTTETKGSSNILRNDILNVLCEFRSAGCAQLSKKFFKQIKLIPSSHSEIIPANLQDSMYCGIVMNGGQEAWEYVNELHATETNFWRSKYLAKALGCTTEPELIKRTMTKVADKSLWENTKDDRVLVLKELLKSATYMQTKVQPDDVQTAEFVTQLFKFLREQA